VGLVLKIHVFFEDVPYAQPSYKRLGLSGRRKKIGSGKRASTREVAAILERKYHIVRYFLDNHAEEITEPILDIMNARMLVALGGGVIPKKQKVQMKSATASFVRMIRSREMDGKVPGVPTAASLGYTSKRSRKRVRRRPSFYDHGLYANSFRLYVEV
jgi:hypothetical protein